METSAPAVARPRYARLDVMRAVAAIAVMTYHVSSVQMWDVAPFNAVVANGERGVYVFFALSGFLVFRPFVEGPVATWGYAVKRVLRIMPAYILALVLVTLLTGDPMLGEHPLEFLLLLQNYDASLFQGIVPTAWTLVLEMQFYLLLPLAAVILVPLLRRRPLVAVILLINVGLISMLVRILAGTLSPQHEAVRMGLPVSLPAELWAFVPGMLVAIVVATRPTASARLASGPLALIAAVLISFGWMTTGSPGQEVLAEICLTVGVAMLIPWLIRPRTHELRSVGALAWFGLVASYPFYLWHRTVIDQVRPFDLPGPVAWVMVLLVTTVIGVLSYRIVERPAMGLATRLAHGPLPWTAVRVWTAARLRGTRTASTAPTDG